MVAAIVVSSIVLGLLLVFLIILFLIYRVFFYSPIKGQNDKYNMFGLGKLDDKDKMVALIDKMRAIPYEDLYAKSYDGIKLHAYFYENPNSNDYVLMFNGYRGNSRRDYSSRALDIMSVGKNIILCDQRGHGLSGGHTITLGRKEQHDVVSWVKYVKERFGEKARIAVGGTSFGATTVLLSSNKLPEDVKVFADGGFASQKGLVKTIIKNRKLNANLLWPLVYLSALIFGHFRMVDDAAINVSESKCQILIIHCSADRVVPMEVNKKLFSINKENVQFVFYENLDHAEAYFKEHDRYMKMLVEFLDK